MSFLSWLTGSKKSAVTWRGPVTVTEVPKLSVDVKYYFTRATGDLDKQLIKVIDSSRVTLDIAIYTLTKQTITDAIIKARNRGVKVRIITIMNG